MSVIVQESNVHDKIIVSFAVWARITRSIQRRIYNLMSIHSIDWKACRAKIVITFSTTTSDAYREMGAEHESIWAELDMRRCYVVGHY